MAAVIALDAMGGDQAPGPEVAGAVAAVRDHGARVLLLGDEPRLRRELSRLRAAGLGIPIRHCSEVIAMADAPGQAVRGKRDSSMRVAFELLRQGAADAVVSAGNSGAMLACGLLVLGRIAGVERPGILTTFPTLRSGPCALLDMGANVECKASHLAQFAVLGATFARLQKGARPAVGLLSNGAEESKGTELLREAHELLRRPVERDFDYVGFVEGDDIFCYQRHSPRPGGLDVVVTDGFTGNVLLKTAEGAARLIAGLFQERLRAALIYRLGALLMRPALLRMKRLLDVESRGGAVLLGVSGTVVICHGRSSARAVESAILLAQREAEAGMAPALAQAIARHRPLWERAAEQKENA